MCFKSGTNELGTVRSLIIMSVAMVLAEALECDPDGLEPEMQLVADLGMTPAGAAAFREGIAAHFDGLEIDLDGVSTVGELFDHVAAITMEGQLDRDEGEPDRP